MMPENRKAVHDPYLASRESGLTLLGDGQSFDCDKLAKQVTGSQKSICLPDFS